VWTDVPCVPPKYVPVFVLSGVCIFPHIIQVRLLKKKVSTTSSQEKKRINQMARDVQCADFCLHATPSLESTREDRALQTCLIIYIQNCNSCIHEHRCARRQLQNEVCVFRRRSPYTKFCHQVQVLEHVQPFRSIM